MPIRISKHGSAELQDRGVEVAWLCDEDFELSVQLVALSSWVLSEGIGLEPGHYGIDIGFGPRENAGGGGESLSPAVMKVIAEKGMMLYFSEYSAFGESDET